ncbi:ankyrin repeat domain-containing protein [soil metagenome]
MNRSYKLVTIVVSLASMMLLTVATHFVITQIPEEIKFNIDLLGGPVDVNAFDTVSGVTPLMQAAIDSDYERTKILLAAGANPNIRSANADQDYAINYALINGGKLGSLAVAKLLLANGADVHVYDARGMRPIHKMMFVQQQDIARRNINIDTLSGENNNNRWEILQELMRRGADINAQAEDGSTMLHITVTNFDRDWIDTLNKEYGQILNYNIKDNKGRTPLDLAIELGMVSVYGTESVENSIRRRPRYIGDDYNITAMDQYKRNGLQLAVIRKDMKFVQELAGHGADLAHQDEWGNTALHYAVTNGAPAEYVRYLLSKNAPTNLANNDGKTPLFNIFTIPYAPLRYEVAQMLVDAGSPIAHKDNRGRSVIDLATNSKMRELFSNALKNRAQKQKPLQPDGSLPIAAPAA